jgi:hypothetical protein
LYLYQDRDNISAFGGFYGLVNKKQVLIPKGKQSNLPALFIVSFGYAGLWRNVLNFCEPVCRASGP